MFVPTPVNTGLAAAHLIVIAGAPIWYAKGVAHEPPISVVLATSTVPQGGTCATATGVMNARAETAIAITKLKLTTVRVENMLPNSLGYNVGI